MSEQKLELFIKDLERRAYNRAHKHIDSSYAPVRSSWKKHKSDLIINIDGNINYA